MINPEMRFLVKLVKLDLSPAIGNNCVDSVTVWQTASTKLDSNASIVSHLLYFSQFIVKDATNNIM